jgi:hypothetical protein
MQAINRDEVPVAVEGEGVELRTQKVGETTVAFVTLEEGTDLSPATKGLPDDLCPCPHWGYMLKGGLAMTTKTGRQVYRAGQALYWGPGHVPVALDDCEYVDFSPTAEFEAVIRHIKGEG